MSKPDYKKITQVLNYLAGKEGGKINYMKALKLSYLADRLHMRKYGRLITEDKLVAMKNGMLGSQAKDVATMSDYLPHLIYEYAKDRLKKDGYSILAKDAETNRLSETDIECLNEVFEVLGQENEYTLAKLTHKLPEWERHKYVIEKEIESVVSAEMSDLFQRSDNPILNNIYSQSTDELSLSQELFSESLDQRAYIE